MQEHGTEEGDISGYKLRVVCHGMEISVGNESIFNYEFIKMLTEREFIEKTITFVAMNK